MVIIINEGIAEIGFDKGTTFTGNKNIQKLVCPSTLEVIFRETCALCSNLKEVVFNEGLQLIGIKAFSGCGLTKLTTPSTLRVINSSAFESCKELKTVTITEGCQVIKANAFGYCNNLETLILPKSLIKISPGACIYCPNLKNIIFDGDIDKVDGLRKLIEKINHKTLDDVIENATEGIDNKMGDFDEEILIKDILENEEI